MGRTTRFSSASCPLRRSCPSSCPCPEARRLSARASATLEIEAARPYPTATPRFTSRCPARKARPPRSTAAPAWNALDSYAVSGFLPSGTDHPNETLNFCRARTSVYLNFTAEGEVTRVDANINIVPEGEDVSWCQQPPQSEWQQPPLPALVAPEGSTSGTPDLMYGGATPGLGSSVIALETDLNGTELLAHYAAQLEGAGWQEIRTVGEGPLSVASYRFRVQGSSHLGTLQVLQNGQPGRYIAQMSALPR